MAAGATITDNAARAVAAPRLTVLIPFFRDDPVTLLEALDRQEVVAGQVEVVTLDDGSGDDDLAARVAQNVDGLALPARFVRLADNAGRSGARNELVRHARGSHVLFLDGDMLPDRPDFLATYLRLIDAEDPAVAFGGFSVEHAPSDRGVAVHRALTSRSDCIPAARRRADPAKYVFTSNLLVRRSIVDELPFDEGHTGWGYEDVEWGLRASARWPITHIDNTATHLGLERVEVLVAKYRQSVPNFARVVARHRELVQDYPSYRVAEVLARLPGLGLLRAVLPRVAASPLLPVSIRSFALRLFRAALYADATRSEEGAAGPDALRRARWRVRETALAVWDRRISAPTVPSGAVPMLAVSCHLDDAVLSCGQVLAAHPGSLVVTVMTEQVAELAGRTAWDVACGFRPGDDVMSIRRAEDRRATRIVGVMPRWLGEVEGQYGVTTDFDVVAERIAAMAADVGVATVLFPLGIDHFDHRNLADAVFRRVHEHGTDVAWIAYDDLPYREQFPQVHRDRLDELAGLGIRLEPVTFPRDPSPGRKRAAVRSYRTQCRPLWRDVRSLSAPEGYWRVVDQ